MGMLPPYLPPIVEGVKPKNGQCELCGTIGVVAKHRYEGEKLILCGTCAHDLNIYFMYIKPKHP